MVLESTFVHEFGEKKKKKRPKMYLLKFAMTYLEPKHKIRKMGVVYV